MEAMRPWWMRMSAWNSWSAFTTVPPCVCVDWGERESGGDNL